MKNGKEDDFLLPRDLLKISKLSFDMESDQNYDLTFDSLAINSFFLCKYFIYLLQLFENRQKCLKSKIAE